MKHSLKARVLSLSLALVMLLPMISIPTFAETGAVTYASASESFDGKTRTDVLNGTAPLTSKVTAATKDADTHGDVLQLDTVPSMPEDFYLYKSDSDKIAVDPDYDLQERSGKLFIVEGTAGDIDLTNALVATKWSEKANYGSTGYALVTGEALDASRGGGNMMIPAKIKHPALSGEGDFIVVEMDLYLSADTMLNNGITSRLYMTQSNKRAEMFKIGKSTTAGYVSFEKHGDANAFKSQNGTKLLALDEWHTITILIDRTSTVLTAYADGEYVFQSISNHTNGTGIYSLVGNDALPLTPKANGLEVEVTRGNSDPSVMKGYVQIDNASLSLKDVGDLSFSHDFEGATLGGVSTQAMTGASIVDATVDADAHGDVLQINTHPNVSTAYYLWTNNNNKWPITGTVTNGLLTGTCTKGTITDAAIPTGDADTSKKYKIGETEYTIVTGNYADMMGGVENYSKPIKLKQPYLDFAGDFYTVSFDIYLSADFKASGGCGFTGRMLVDGVSGAETRIQLFQIYADGNTNVVYIRRHGDANQYGGRNTQMERECWNRIDIVIDRNTTRQYVLLNGEFAFETLSDKSGQKPTSELLGTDALPMVVRANELQFENNRGAKASEVGGYVQLDNVRVTVGDAAADYRNVVDDFDGIAVGSSDHGMGQQSASTPISGSTVKNNYGSNAWNIPLAGNNNKGQYLYTPIYSYTTGGTMVYEVDYFIEADAIGQIQQQLQSFTANGNGTGTRVSGTWLDLYQIRFDGNGSATFKFENASAAKGVAGAEALLKTTVLETGRWNNIALVIDLVDGVYDVYINGSLTFESVPLYRNINNTFYRLTEVEVDPNKITVGKTNTVKGMAYSGNIQLDNVRIFTGDKPTMAATNPNATDFEEFKYSVGKNAGMAKLPSLATIETLTDGNTAFRVDMAPAGSADSYVLMQASGTNAAKATLSGTFVWNLEDKTQGTLDGNAITLVQNGSYYEYTVNDVTYRAVSAAVAGASIGGKNVCVPAKRLHDTFSYATEKTVVLEADYFIEKDSTGIIESQIEKYYYGEEKKESSYFDLYKIYMETGRVDNGLYLNIGEWNNITVILDLASGDAAVYVNGVYSHTKTDKDGNVKVTNITFGGSVDYSWSLAKVFRQVNMNAVPYVGGLLIDNVSVGTELPATSETFGDKFLSDEEFLTFATDSVMQIVNGASIRLKEDGTGLRFATRVDENAIATQIASRLGEGATVEIGKRGTLIAPATYYEAAEEFTHAGLEALPVSTKYVDVAFGGLYFGGDAGVTLPEGNYMVGSIVKLKSYTREFAAAGYLELIVNGESYMLYTDVVIRSAAEVASAALTDPMQSWSDAHREILEDYAGIAQS